MISVSQSNFVWKIKAFWVKVRVRVRMPVLLVVGAGLKPAPTSSMGRKSLTITRRERFQTVPYYTPNRLPNLNHSPLYPEEHFPGPRRDS